MTRSVVLTLAFCAARCAKRSLLTRCSGVSPGTLGGVLEATAAEALEAAEAPAALEVAWGMVEVKRVASLTLRGATRDAMVMKRGSSDGLPSGGRDWRDGGVGSGESGVGAEGRGAGGVMRFFEEWNSGPAIGAVEPREEELSRTRPIHLAMPIWGENTAGDDG